MTFWRKDIGAKAAQKMMIKLTRGVNFIIILQEKAAQNTFV